MFWRHLSRFLLAFSFLSSADIFPQAEEFVDLQIITVASQQQLREILALLEKGQEFADLAREYSTDPTAGNGGFLGRMQLSDLNEGLRGGVGKAAAGAIVHFSDPQLGLTIVRRLDARTADRAYSLHAVQLGAAELGQKRNAQAIQQFKKAISLDPGWAEAHLRLGHAYRMTGSYNLIGEAKGEFRQALALDPEHVSARFLLSRAYLDLEFPGKARQVLEEKADLTARSPQLLSLLGELDRRDGHPELSIERNQAALKMDPSSTGALYYLARAYLELEETAKAREVLDQVVASTGATSDMFVTAGSFFLNENDLDRAVELLEWAIELAPSLPEAHLELGRAYRMKGAFESALEQLELALRHGRAFSASPQYREFEQKIHFERTAIEKGLGKTP